MAKKRCLQYGLARACWLLVSVVVLVACRRNSDSIRTLDPDEFSIMTYNLGRYGLDDRTGNGQKIDPKPASERDAVIAVIAEARPDVLAVQEIGNSSVFAEFKQALKAAGLDYGYSEHMPRGQSELNLAVLSRFPITDSAQHTDDVYTIGPARVSVLRGFLEVEVEVNPQYRFRLIAAHLKSKVFHALGQTEMRRNEARLLNKHVRRILKANPQVNLVVVGDMNDTCRSAALREIMGKRSQHLQDMRPRDMGGDVWTHYDSEADQYNRVDYILACRGMMNELVPDKTRVVRDSRTYLASDHRPVLAVFKAWECKPSSQTEDEIPEEEADAQDE